MKAKIIASVLAALIALSALAAFPAFAEGEELISGLKKLAKGNFADLSPDPWLVKLDYSHPTLSQRIDAIRKKG